MYTVFHNFYSMEKNMGKISAKLTSKISYKFFL